MTIPYDNGLTTLFGLSQLPQNSYEFGGQAFTTQELWIKIAEKINVIIEHFNYLDKNFTNEKENTKEKLEYLLGEGLAESVARKLLELIADGTLGKLINETLLKEINDKVDIIDLDLIKNTQQAVLKKVNPKLLPFPLVRAKGDGITNDTDSINSALSLLKVRPDSNIDFNDRAGVLELDEGVYLLDEIIARSNLTIRGQGMGKTILIPNINNIDDFFIKVNYTGESKLCNFELENLSILKTPEHQFAIEPIETRKLSSILDLSQCTSVKIKNVIISGFKGTGIRLKESFDTNIDNLQMIGCGDETHNSIEIINNENDGSNAIHFNGCRIEGCNQVLIEGADSKFNREIQFIGGKYEHVPFKIKGSSNINFCGSHFTYNKIETPLITVADGVNTETYGINFNGCSFLGVNNGYLCNSTSGRSIKFIGCSFKGFKKGFTGSNINIVGSEFYDMVAPIFDVTTNLKACNNDIVATGGADGEYIFKVSTLSNINNNNIAFNKNTKLHGCILNGDGNLVADNFFMTCVNGIDVQGNSNRVKGNKGSIIEKVGATFNILEHYSSVNIPKNSESREGNLRINNNKLELYRSSNNSWGEVFVRAGNVSNLDNGSSLENCITKINEIISALKTANFMIQ